MNSPCPGPCNNAPRRAVEEHEQALAVWHDADPETRGEPPEPSDLADAWTDGDPVWCGRCAARIRASLAELDYLVAILVATADGHRQVTKAEPVSGSHATPTPSAPVDLADELLAYLTKVEEQWREFTQLGPRPARPRGARALTTVIAWLLGHLDDILANHGSAGFGRSVLGWHRRLEHITKTEPELCRRPAPCPRCDKRSLARRDDGYTICRDCGRLLSEDEYQDLVQTAADREAS